MPTQTSFPELQSFSTMEALLEALFEQSTGRHFLDSGSAYGRHWERNQDLKTYKHATCVNVGSNWLQCTVGTYDFLKGSYALPEMHLRKAYDTAIQEAASFSSEDVMIELHDVLDKQDITLSNPYAYNTYNSPSLLSQGIQSRALTIDGGAEMYELIELHQGCDIRGGYTRPVLLKCKEEHPHAYIDVVVSSKEHSAIVTAHTSEDEIFTQLDVKDIVNPEDRPEMFSAYFDVLEFLETWERRVKENRDRLPTSQVEAHEATMREMKAKEKTKEILLDTAREENVLVSIGGKAIHPDGGTLTAHYYGH